MTSFAVVRRVVVVLHQALAHLAGRDAHHRVGVCVVGRRATENLDADAALLEFGPIAAQGLLHGIGQQRRVALAVGKQRMSQQPLQLLANGCLAGGSSDEEFDSTGI